MHMHQQNHWNRVLFYWYQSYHWHQWTISLTNRIRLCLLDMCGSFGERVKLCCGKQGNIKEHQFRVETFINQLPLANQALVPKVTRYKPSSSCRVAFPVSLLLLFSAINSSNHVVFDKACSLALARTVASAEKSFLNSWSTCVSGKS